jgi:PIN domain nuclease of toxin-antitoxin system
MTKTKLFKISFDLASGSEDNRNNTKIRMIIATAMLSNMTISMTDTIIPRYNVSYHW